MKRAMNRIDDKNIGFVWRGLFFFACVTFLSFESISQCKTYKLTDRGDTINCIDLQGKKQGPWLEVFPELRGNPGYEEEGEYLDGQKEGIWRRYTMQGDVMAVESYRWGLKNGKSMYYSLFGLEREESWWAIDPKQKFDTIDVPDLYVDGNYRTVIVPNEGRSMKHGSWVLYNSQTGRIEKTEEYIRDSAVGVLGALGITSKKSNPKPAQDSTGKKMDKPDVVQEWEKKNAGKKKVKVRDGSTGYN
jgi:antitoxin component YwqK of YwqJK toxin-antitoxin module